MTPTGNEWRGYDLWDEESIRQNAIKELQQRILDYENARPQACPHCGKKRLVKFGKTNKGTQRYRCPACGGTCSPRGIIAGSQLSKETWMRFAECYVDGLSIRKSAERCKVSMSTAYRMKCKLDGMEEPSNTPFIICCEQKVYRAFRDLSAECYRAGETGCPGDTLPAKHSCTCLSSIG